MTSESRQICSQCGHERSASAAAAGLCAHCLLKAGCGHDYLVVNVLGQGQHGTVYLAEQQPSGRLVALKVFAPGGEADDILSRVRWQAPLLEALAHPCAARMLDIGLNEQQRPYVATEYIRGAPITRHCERANSASPDRLELLAHVRALLRAVHKRGVAHGAIKASNILVSRNPRGPAVTVTDFGMQPGDKSGDDLALMTLADELLQPVDACGQFHL